MLNNSLELAFQAQLFLVYGISQEIHELLGSRQSKLFEGEILASIPTMKSLPELHQALNIVAKHSSQSLQSYQLDALQMKALHQSFQRLSTQYLGKEYAAETVKTVFSQLPVHLKKNLVQWFETLK